MSGDMDLKPNTFTYNAVINALAKSGEPDGRCFFSYSLVFILVPAITAVLTSSNSVLSAAARAERVLHNMVNRHRNGGCDDVKPTTINFNTVSKLLLCQFLNALGMVLQCLTLLLSGTGRMGKEFLSTSS